jgi:hypothetical protein
MLTLAPISKDFVPYNRRPATRSIARSYSGVGGPVSGSSRVVPQQILDQCAGRPNCTPCGYGGRCYHGYCVYSAPGCP